MGKAGGGIIFLVIYSLGPVIGVSILLNVSVLVLSLRHIVCVHSLVLNKIKLAVWQTYSKGFT